jgi:hypothetical protein
MKRDDFIFCNPIGFALLLVYGLICLILKVGQFIYWQVKTK